MTALTILGCCAFVSSVRAQQGEVQPEATEPPAEPAPEAGVEAAVSTDSPTEARDAEATPAEKPQSAADVAPSPKPLEEHASQPSEVVPEDATVDIDSLLEEDSAVEQSTLSIYGFADFGYQRLFRVHNRHFIAPFLPSRAGSFVVGNANLYFDANPTLDTRALIEVRFTNYPNGEETAFAVPGVSDYERTNTEIYDTQSTSGGDRVRYGSIVLERAWAQYKVSDALMLRVGQFLTPAGIWNVDHGPITLIPLSLPFLVTRQAFPRRQTGVQALGIFNLGSTDFSYRAYVSNGRTPGQVDFTDDKALGGRMFFTLHGGVTSELGMSAYYGTFNDIEKTIESFDPFVVSSDFVVKGEEMAFGADASFDIGGLRLRTEGVMQRITYESDKHAPSQRPGAVQPNAHFWSAYQIIAYRLPWAGLEPYAFIESMYRPSDSYEELGLSASGGLNVHLNPSAQLKLQYQHAWFLYPDEPVSDPARSSFGAVFTRFAVAF